MRNIEKLAKLEEFYIAKLEEKDEELERLKVENGAWQVGYKGIKAELERLKAASDWTVYRYVKAIELIEQLSDALEASASSDPDWARQTNHLYLVSSAREATE